VQIIIQEVGTSGAELWSIGRRGTLVTKKAANHQNVDNGYRQHNEELESRPEVDTLEVVLLNAAVS